MAGRPAPSSAADGGAQVTIFVGGLSGWVCAVQVSLDDPVEDLRKKVEDIQGPLPDSRLIFMGKVMKDGQSLRSYGVTSRSTVYVVLKMRGGGHPADLPQVSDLPTATAQGGEKTKPPHSSSPERAETEEQTREARTAVAACQFPASLKKKCKRCVREALPEVSPEIVAGGEQNKTIYRAHLPGAGSFHCSETGLGFKVTAAMTIEYEYGSWAESLSLSAREDWMIAGPLFHIRAEPGAVRAVHLPHFVCLADGADESLCQIAHFEAGKMSLKSPTQINPFFAVLVNPSFSQLGVLWRKIRSAIKFIPIHSLVLIYRTLSAADITLHLYLIPNDHSLQKAIEEKEIKWKSKPVPKSPQTDPLYFEAWYQVSSPSDLEITPTQLFFCYWSPGEQQSYIEIYAGAIKEGIRLHVHGRDDGNLVWEAVVRPGDVSLSTLSSQVLSGAAFVRTHWKQLRDRMGQIQPVLACLRETQLLTSEEEEEVRSERTSRMKNDALLRLVERKGPRAQEELYQTLKEMDPYLVQDLEQSS